MDDRHQNQPLRLGTDFDPDFGLGRVFYHLLNGEGAALLFVGQQPLDHRLVVEFGIDNVVQEFSKFCLPPNFFGFCGLDLRRLGLRRSKSWRSIPALQELLLKLDTASF